MNPLPKGYEPSEQPLLLPAEKLYIRMRKKAIRNHFAFVLICSKMNLIMDFQAPAQDRKKYDIATISMVLSFVGLASFVLFVILIFIGFNVLEPNNFLQSNLIFYLAMFGLPLIALLGICLGVLGLFKSDRKLMAIIGIICSLILLLILLLFVFSQPGLF